MKQIINAIGLCGLLCCMTSCEKDLPLYNTEDCWLNFWYDMDNIYEFNESVKRVSYSFVYGGEDVMTDTIWIPVETMGFVYDENRPLELQQVSTGENDAVADVHYRSFDNQELKQRFYFIPGGKARVDIPIVVLRDASLKQTDVTLKFTFKENDYFKVGYDAYSERTIVISDRLSRPNAWDECYLDYYIGVYGPVKHQFLITETGEKWDEEYIPSLMNGDSTYREYLFEVLRRRLVEYNEERHAQGLGDLCEADGTLVDFTPLEW